MLYNLLRNVLLLNSAREQVYSGSNKESNMALFYIIKSLDSFLRTYPSQIDNSHNTQLPGDTGFSTNPTPFRITYAQKSSSQETKQNTQLQGPYVYTLMLSFSTITIFRLLCGLNYCSFFIRGLTFSLRLAVQTLALIILIPGI